MNLSEICQIKLKEKGLSDDQRYKKRLKWELAEVKGVDLEKYFLNLYEKKVRFRENEHNLLIVWLLGLVKQVDIDKDPSTEMVGDLPDCDVDLESATRQFIKNDWAPKRFGKNYVCNIGTYAKYGIKSSLIDITRLYEGSRDEVLAITKNLEEKDEDGNLLNWEKALEINKGLAEFCIQYPEIAKDASQLMSRFKSQGLHAGGLIISSVPLDDFLPLILDKSGNPTSAWTEGLNEQELGPVGLVKFDLLVISDLKRLAKMRHTAKTRNNLTGIFALPGNVDFSDEIYLEDEKLLEMANKADLKGIFQFDSSGIRRLAKEGGITKFSDFYALNALYRPGPLGSGMAESFIKRKTGKEQYEIHPVLEPILSETYGLMIYQEQIAKILNKVGLIPLKDCETVRKAISKKKIEKFIQYKEMFIENGQKVLSWTKEQMEEMFGQILKWAGYGFNKAHAVAYSVLAWRLLLFKVYYNLDFFSATLHYETDEKKIKEYKTDALSHGVSINPIDINKSKVRFEIHELEKSIYCGFANLKGVGDEIAKKIVNNQNYNSFEEFLDKFGTTLDVVKALVGLRVFNDQDSLKLYKFYEVYKKKNKKVEDRQKRYEKGCIDRKQTLLELLKGYEYLAVFDEEHLQIWAELFEGKIEKIYEDIPDEEFPEIMVPTVRVVDRFKELKTLYNKEIKAVKSGYEKGEKEENNVLLLKDFDSNDYDIEIKEDLLEILLSKNVAEKKFYGFSWTHLLESSPDYVDGKTFDDFREIADINSGSVQVQINQVKKIVKDGKKPRYLVEVEDVNGEINSVNFWSNDYDRWKEELIVGNLVQMRVKPPHEPYPSYGFESPAWNDRNKVPKHKKDDYRLIVLKK